MGEPRVPLTPQRIAAAALSLIDEVGLEAFSMRGLGQRLGVEAMALYHHHASRGRLLDAVMDELVAGIALPPGAKQPLPPLPPLLRLRGLVSGWRGLALAHPRAFPLLVGRRFNSPGAFAFYEQVLQCLRELGLAPAQAARWFRTLGYFASGAGMADVAGHEQEPDATPLALQHAPQSAPFAHVAAVAPYLRIEHLDEVFEAGLDVLFAALQAECAKTAAALAARAGPVRQPRAGP